MTRSQVLRVAFVTTRPEFLGDRIFNYPPDLDTSSALKKWVLLRDEIEASGGILHTYDWYEDHGQRPDVILADDATGAMARLLLSLVRTFRLSPRRVMLILWEPPVIRPAAWRWLPVWSRILGAVGTSNREVAGRGARYTYIPLPQPSLASENDGALDAARSNPRSRFAVMVRSNKTSTSTSELYSKRRELIRFYETHHPDAFDLFGFGWNVPEHPQPFSTPLYRGEASHQLDIFPTYQFAISIDNSAEPGLVTYDLFSAMRVGTVPVYLGAPDITDFVPSDCFIDMRDYATFEELHQRMREVADGPDWERYRRAGARYLASDAIGTFTNEKFVSRVVGRLNQISRKPPKKDKG